ncbi:MAG: carboxylating nicotinate-nucleotide diphosphorylase [Actinomycetota bacterium]|nr:carboxylating nicotinate-nucleotide diphosphorylase [Actinomycetota bacterium]
MDPDHLSQLVARALAEDIGSGDVTSEATVPPEARASARVVQKERGVVFGFDAAAEAFRQTGAGELQAVAAEGEWRDEVPLELATITGPARAILAAERVALNFLGHLSGIATLARQFVDAASPGGARILDTRKTIPGLRLLAKEAVAAGGGTNHRLGLFDAILIKENHAELAGGVAEAVVAARAAQPGLAVEVEVRDAEEVAQALAARADRLLLDNMGFPGLRAAVAARDQAERASGHRAELEASGGVSLDAVAGISETGVDFISVGALTHSAPALDLSLLLDLAP